MQTETLDQKLRRTCVYFNGIQHEVCNIGVKYDDVRVDGIGIPCLCVRRDGIGGESIPCDKRRYPSAEEIKAEKERIDKMFEDGQRVMDAVTKDAADKGFRKGNGGDGVIDCPVCEDGRLAYRVSGYNGHRHAKCSSVGCVSFME